MHLFDEGWNKLRETDLRQPEEARRDLPNAELTPWPKEVLKKWDTLNAGREEAVHPAGRSLCRVSGLHRPRDRPRDPDRRGDGQARQHADHLHQRRQRLERRRIAERHTERGRPVQRGRALTSREQLKSSMTRGDRARPIGHLAVGWTWAFDTPFKWTKQMASHLRRHATGRVPWHGRHDQGRGRHPPSVPSRDRHRADDPRGDGHSGTRSWWTASLRSRSKA